MYILDITERLSALYTFLYLPSTELPRDPPSRSPRAQESKDGPKDPLKFLSTMGGYVY